MGLDSIFAVFMLEDAAVAVCLRLETHLFPHTRDASFVDDEKHVDARDRLRWQSWRPHTELSVVSVTLIVVSVTLLTKRQLHVAITGRQAVRVVIAAQHDDRRDPMRVARDGDLEVPPIGNLLGGLRDHGSRGPSAGLREQVRREEQLSDGNALVGIPAWEQSGIR